MELKDHMRELCKLGGISGYEDAVREYIISAIDGKCEYTTDPLGSVIVHCKGKRPANHKLLISAHMDEVGLMITYICGDGCLKFDTVGGIDPRVLFGKRVYVGKDKLCGVIGGTAVHNLSKEERENAPSVSDMTIDIGCRSKEAAEKLVRPGDSVIFDTEYTEFGSGRICSKAIDDRAGCAVMLKMIEDGVEYDTEFTFVVQEEVGLRGAQAAAYTVAPEFAIVLEATTAADIPSAKEEKRVCEVGKGPVVSFMDRHTIYDKELYAAAFELAEKSGIPVQTKSVIAGGNDAGAIHVSRAGVRTAAVSLPCRYLHSPSCVISEEDLENAYRLTKLLCERIQTL